MYLYFVLLNVKNKSILNLQVEQKILKEIR